MVRHREQCRAGRRDHQQHALDPPWTISVQEDADGYLGGGESQEVNRRKQAKIVGTEPQFRRQWSRHDRIDRPEQIGNVIADDEWQEYTQDQRPVFDRVFCHPVSLPLAKSVRIVAVATAPSSSSIARQVAASVKRTLPIRPGKPNIAAVLPDGSDEMLSRDQPKSMPGDLVRKPWMPVPDGSPLGKVVEKGRSSLRWPCQSSPV